MTLRNPPCDGSGRNIDDEKPDGMISVSSVRAWMTATPFTQCPEWSAYVERMIATLTAGNRGV